MSDQSHSSFHVYYDTVDQSSDGSHQGGQSSEQSSSDNSLKHYQLRLNNTVVESFDFFQIKQCMQNHGSFELMVAKEVVEEELSDIRMSKGRELLGGTLTLGFKNNEQANYKGVITGIRTIKDFGHYGKFVITGRGYSAVIDSEKQQRSWQEVDLATIVNEVIADNGNQELETHINPTYTQTIAY